LFSLFGYDRFWNSSEIIFDENSFKGQMQIAFLMRSACNSKNKKKSESEKEKERDEVQC